MRAVRPRVRAAVAALKERVIESESDRLLARAIDLHRAGEGPQAALLYRELLVADPRHADALHLLGLLEHQAGRNEQAAMLVRQAIAIRPDAAAYHSNLAHIFTVLKQLDAAVESCRQAIALDRTGAAAWLNLGNALKELGRIDQAIECFDHLRRLHPGYVYAHSNLLYSLHYAQGRSQAEVFAQHRQFAADFEAPLRAGWRAHANRPDPARRLRIGYLSPDLREHPVACYLEPVLAQRDRSAFEVTCYHDHLQAEAFTARLAALSDHWTPCKHLGDDALAERIRADAIDVLIDLTGHTADHRLLVFARKPAPVQMTWLGYIGSTGLTAMDWRLSHIDADPPGNEAFYSERLYRFDKTLWWTWRPRASMPEVGPSPAAERGHVSFGSTNNIGKLGGDVIAAWIAILLRVPGSRLVLAGIPDGSPARLLRQQFQAAGIAPERLVVLGKLVPEQFWALHGEIDLMLDPFPYNGGATSCDALWLGVPLVALKGRAFVSRMGFALLTSLGLAELAADDVAGYVELAVALAQDPARLADLRAGLRQRVAQSPLRDEAGFTRALEAAFRHGWQQWCLTQAGSTAD